MYTLLAERLMGHPVIEHVSMWQARGSEMEAEAIRFYELQRDMDTTPIGFVTNEDGTVGASPDRFVGDEGLLEIKCPAEWQHLSFLMNSGSVFDYCRVQVLGQLWITDRRWVDVLSFHPELPPALVRIERDEPFIDLLAKAVTAFSRALEAQFAELVARGWYNGPPRRERPMTIEDVMREALRERAHQ